VDQPSGATSSASYRHSRPTRSSRATSSRDIFPVCERFGFGAIVWSPLEGGWLGGRIAAAKTFEGPRRAANETEFGMFVRDNFKPTPSAASAG